LKVPLGKITQFFTQFPSNQIRRISRKIFIEVNCKIIVDKLNKLLVENLDKRRLDKFEVKAKK
jgi:hypothetical protein